MICYCSAKEVLCTHTVFRWLMRFLIRILYPWLLLHHCFFNLKNYFEILFFSFKLYLLRISSIFIIPPFTCLDFAQISRIFLIEFILSLLSCDKSHQILILSICFFMLFYKKFTHHGIYVKLLAHVTELITKFRIWVYFIFVSLCELCHIGLKIVVYLFNLTKDMRYLLSVFLHLSFDIFSFLLLCLLFSLCGLLSHIHYSFMILRIIISYGLIKHLIFFWR